MTKLEPFYIYAVFGEDGEMKHSGISYGVIDTTRPPTQAELREALLISATFAEDEYQWPAHSQPDGKQLTNKLYGPFRSDERRVGKECVSTCRSRWSPLL